MNLFAVDFLMHDKESCKLCWHPTLNIGERTRPIIRMVAIHGSWALTLNYYVMMITRAFTTFHNFFIWRSQIVVQTLRRLPDKTYTHCPYMPTQSCVDSHLTHPGSSTYKTPQCGRACNLVQCFLHLKSSSYSVTPYPIFTNNFLFILKCRQKPLGVCLDCRQDSHPQTSQHLASLVPVFFPFPLPRTSPPRFNIYIRS
jgi:hypothetical protein